MSEQDTNAMDRIEQILSATEWDADTMMMVVDVIKASGRTISDVTPDKERERADEVHDWGVWFPIPGGYVRRECISHDYCGATQETEYGRCAVCDNYVIELPTDYGPGHTTWVPHGDWDNYDPCVDENGLPAPHEPTPRGSGYGK